MSSKVSDEQLQSLVNLVNNRLREFGPDTFPLLSWGVVRLIHNAVEEWMGFDLPDAGAPNAPDAYQEVTVMDGYHIGYHIGYEKGFEAGKLAVNVFSPQREAGEISDSSGEKHLVSQAIPTNGNGNGNGTEQTPWDKLMTDFDVSPLKEAGEGNVSGGETSKMDEAIDATPKAEPEPMPEPDDAPDGIESIFSEKPDAPPITHPQAPIGVPRLPRTLEEADALVGAGMGKEERAADLRNTIYALQEMAVDGVMPSAGAWNENRPKGMLTATGIMGRHNLTWTELGGYAKLAMKRAGRVAANE